MDSFSSLVADMPLSQVDTSSAGSNVVPFDATSEFTRARLLQDLNLIIVGSGAKAAQLARRRAAAGGRMTILWTDRQPAGPCVSEEVVWLPPNTLSAGVLPSWGFLGSFSSYKDPTLDKLAKEFGVGRRRRQCKAGPDVITLTQEQEYWIAETTGQKGVGGLRVTSGDGSVAWEMSGQVVLAVESRYELDVNAVNVEVHHGISKPCQIPHFPRFLPWLPYAFLWMFLSAVGAPLEAKGDPPYWKLHFAFFVAIPFGYCISNDFIGLAAFGVADEGLTRYTNMATCFLTFSLAMIVPWYDGRYLTDFCVCALGTLGLFFVALPLHAYRIRSWPRYWQWGIAVLFCSVGAWVVVYMNIIAFLLFQGVQPVLASIVFPFLTAGTEVFYMTVLSHAYCRWGLKPGALGEQSAPLMVCACLVHGYAEGARLTGSTVGAVLTGGYSWIFTSVIGLALNLGARHGWTRYYLRTLMRTRSKRAQRYLRPFVVSRLYDEAKFLYGYPRFITPLALATAQLIHGSFPLFNLPGLSCVVVTFFMELVEDIIVILAIIPAPPHLGQKTSWSTPGDVQPFNAGPIFSPASAAPARPACTSGCLALYGCRPLSFMHHGVLLMPTTVFMPCLLHLFLGAGYVAGLCEVPLAPAHRISQALLWTRPFTC